jgi:outer membrane beta-barrel protein
LGCAALAMALLSANVAWAQSQEEEAGDVSEVDKDATGPLRERIRPVSGHVFLKSGRFEISPSAAVSIKDAFFTKYMFGATAAFHLSEQFALGLRFNYSIPVVSGSALICVVDATGLNRTCRSPGKDELAGDAPGLLNMMGGLDFYWAPIYGKISLTSEAFIHFDMYAVLGPQAILYTGPAAGAPLDPATGNTITASKFTVGANVGIGIRIFPSRWFALRTELRDLSYFEQVTAAQTNTWRNQFMFELGFSFFLPTNFNER